MKLYFFFMILDLFTILAYPIVFVQSKIRQPQKSKVNIVPADLLILDAAACGR